MNINNVVQNAYLQGLNEFASFADSVLAAVALLGLTHKVQSHQLGVLFPKCHPNQLKTTCNALCYISFDQNTPFIITTSLYVLFIMLYSVYNDQITRFRSKYTLYA